MHCQWLVTLPSLLHKAGMTDIAYLFHHVHLGAQAIDERNDEVEARILSVAAGLGRYSQRPVFGVY